MRKVLLSLVVLAASGGYAWSQYGKILAQDAAIDGADLGTDVSSAQALPAASTLPVKSAPLETASVVEPPPVSKSSAVTVAGALSHGVDHTVTGSTVAALIAEAAFEPMPPSPAPTPATPTTPTTQPQIASITPKSPVPPQGKYRDGTYRGAAADAYYGLCRFWPSSKVAHWCRSKCCNTQATVTLRATSTLMPCRCFNAKQSRPRPAKSTSFPAQP